MRKCCKGCGLRAHGTASAKPARPEPIFAKNPAVAAVLAGMNPQLAIVTGQGLAPTDSVGFPWTGRYMIASGNGW